MDCSGINLVIFVLNHDYMRIKVFNLLLIFALSGAAFYSCKKTTSQAMRDEEADHIKRYTEKYLPGIKPTASGLYYQELKSGVDTIPIESGDLVKVFYTGNLIEDNDSLGIIDGDVFDSSGDYEPFTFTVGGGTVITGWDEAIRLMNDGAEAKWVIPSKLAYSGQAQNGIPAYSPLVFNVRIYRVYRTDDEFPVISKKPLGSF
jgi:FKBP-type peptidyl-prolyl cis-trans isomerase